MRTSQCIVRHLPFLAVLVGMMLFVSPSKALAQASSGNAGEYLYGTDFIFQYTEIDIDSSYDMDAWTDLYCPDFTLYERGLSLEADLSLFEDGYFIGADVNSGSSDIITDVFAVADPEHNYAADGAAVLWGYCETCYSYYNSIGLGDTWAYVTAPAAPPTIDHIDPTSGNIGDNRVLMHIYGDNLLGTGSASPTILSDSRTNMHFDVQGTSNKNQIDVYYWIASDASPVLGYIGVQTDGGSTQGSGTADFNVGDPPATLTSISPDTWNAGSGIFTLTLTGSHFGSGPMVSIDDPLVTINRQGYDTTADGTTTHVDISVDGNDQGPTANVSVTPGYNIGNGGNSVFQNPNPSSPSTGAAQLPARVTRTQYSISPNPLNLSTGDMNKSLTINNASQMGGTPNITAQFINNPMSNCQATVNIASPSSTSTAVTASPANCSGIFQIVLAGGTPTVTSSLVVPPQIMIQTALGEAMGQVSPGDQTQVAILSTAVNRMNDSTWFSSSTTYQNTLIPSAYYGASNTTTNGPEPELTNAAMVFQGAVGQPVQNAGCIWSPTTTQWSLVQTALNSATTVFPSGTGAPGCYASVKQINTRRQWDLTTHRDHNMGHPPSFFCKKEMQTLRLSYKYHRGFQ